MTEDVGNLTLQRPRRMDGRLAKVEGDLRDISLRATVPEEHVGDVVVSIAGVNARIDRFDKRLARGERRIELMDAR